jgi:hypothetical protein
MKKSLGAESRRTLELSDIRKSARPVLIAFRALQSEHRTAFAPSEIAQWVRDQFGDDGGAGKTAQAIRMLYRRRLISAHSGKYRLSANGQRLAFLAQRNRALGMRADHDRPLESAAHPQAIE